ncbi:unnamed protein product [Closterium sp. NIES-53]
MGNMTMTSGSRRPRARSPSLEPAWHPIRAFSNNNPFSTRHGFADANEQDWNLLVPLLESPPHVPDMRAAPIDWIAREQFLKVDTLHIVTPRLALLTRNDNRRYNTWYLDSCCGQHMLGSERYISNTVRTPTMTYVTVANNTHVRASVQGIIVLKARGSRMHITLNDVLIVQNLCFNLLSAAQLMDCGVDLSTDHESRDILLHFTMPNKTRTQIGRAHLENDVYILDFSILDCSDDSQELIDLVPLRFKHIHHRDWKHPDGRTWVPYHPHPRELALHEPDPDDICRDCHTPTTSTSAIATRGLAAIIEVEREAPPEEGLSHLGLETATNWRNAKQKSFANSALRSRVAHSLGADGAKRRAPPMKGGGEALADGARATLADGEPHLVARQADGALPAKAGGLPVMTKGGKKRKLRQNLKLFLLVALRAALLLHYPHLTSTRN